jgi:alpha-glucosidase
VHFARSQDPWSFGADALAQCRQILRRRYQLLPLFYRLALEAHEQGAPLVRPLQMHYDVPRGEGEEQFLLGSSLLAAPVLHRGQRARELFLPSGKWVDWHTGVEHAGDRRVTVDAPLGRTPLFVRAGFPMFLVEARRNADESLAAPLSLELTRPAAGECASNSLFIDDGSSSRGDRFLLHAEVLAVAPHQLELRLQVHARSFEPVQRDISVRVPAGLYSIATMAGRSQPLARLPLDAGTVIFG